MEKIDPIIFKLGAALYICQIFESSLVLLHMLIDEDEKVEGKVSKIGDDYQKRTLGKLINLLKPRIDIPKNALEYIFEAIGLRNQIVHGYLTSESSILKFESEEGRINLVEDLDCKLKEIRARDLFICGLIDQYLSKYGTSTKKLKKIAERNSVLYSKSEKT